MQFKHLFSTITLLLSFSLAGFAQEPTLLEHGGGVRTVEFSPVNASLFASAGESNLIKLWNLKNNTARTLRGHTGIVNSIAFSPNGNLLASVSDDRTIKLWNVHNSQNIATLREGTQFVTVAFSPDGQLLATGGWRHVKLWDVRRRVVIATLQHDKFIQAVTFSHDGQFLAAGDARESSGTVKVWDVESRQVVAMLEEDLVVVRSVTFSSDDRYLASSHYNGEVKVWNVSDWELLRTMPAGDYDIAFSPDGKMIAGTRNASVNLWWVEDGTKVAQVPGPTGWMHPVDFSHDGTSLAVGGEDGIVRLWRIDTSPIDGREEGTVQILHTDTYFQQLPKANSVNGDDIPDPAPPAAVVRDFYELDPFYEQWINVGGLPVLASAKVNPYAVKEAAWLIQQVIGHSPDLLKVMAGNGGRINIMAHNELITQIPDFSYLKPDFFYDRRLRGLFERRITICGEENILRYRGDIARGYNTLLHEFAHALHELGLNSVKSDFDNVLRSTYESAIDSGLWHGTYAGTSHWEYWAEGVGFWFNSSDDFHFTTNAINTREELKVYDPDLAALVFEVFGDSEWRYTLPTTRTHLPHLQGFNLPDTPTFEWSQELDALYEQLESDPDSDGGGRWVNLRPYDPSELSSLKSNIIGGHSIIILVNLTGNDVLFYSVEQDGVEVFHARVGNSVRPFPTNAGRIWLLKDSEGKNLAAYRADVQTGRILVSRELTGSVHTVIADEPIAPAWDVNRDGQINILDLVLVAQHLGGAAPANSQVDVNGDGTVNILDLVVVAQHLGESTGDAAPSLLVRDSQLDPMIIQAWIEQAYAENDGSLMFQQGIANLHRLLALMIPKETSLLPNYPNPFNPETWIPYQLSKPADVSVSIYAADGRLVRTLALGYQPVGIYESRSRAAYWDGRNTLGEPVASGLYFYTLTAGEFTATRKMLIKK